MVQWLRIRLPMQGTQVRSLVQEDPTCRGTTEAPVPQLLSPCSRTWEPQLLQPTHPRALAAQQKSLQEEALVWRLERSPCLPRLEKARSNEDPAQPKTNK